MTAAARVMNRAFEHNERFLGILRDARDEQRELLQRVVAANADTAFGRAHGFARIRDLHDYRRAVPLRAYDQLRPYIDRSFAGERGVLTAADPVLFFATTGTTGAPKRVPVTREAFFHLARNQLIYWASLAERHPVILERDDTIVMLHLAPRPFEERSPTGVPVLNPTHMPVSGKAALPFARAPWFPPPAELNDADRLYFFLRGTVEHSLAGFVCLHPSRLMGFAARLVQEAPRLIRELHDGGNPTRAREIEDLARTGALTPRTVWPDLQFVACWYGGSFSTYAPHIAESYGAALVPHMSASSEAGHITLPIDGAPMDGPLTVHANHYEFIPVGDDDDDDPTDEAYLQRHTEATVTFEALELGRCYELVLTSPSGLYRYASGDRFEVQGFVHGVPRLGFVGRGGVVDMTGEKISEQHVQAAIDRTLSALSLATAGATCCAVFGTSAHYAFVFEPSGGWTAALAPRLAESLDAELRRLNSRYELKRGFGDLGPPRICIAPPGAFERHRAGQIARGAPATQLKDKLLHTDPAVLTALISDVVGSA